MTKAKQMAASKPIDGRWTLPADWNWRRAKDIAKIVGGSTPKNAADPSNYDDSGTPWLTPADLSGYLKPTIAAGRRSLASHVVGRSGVLPTGSVLISSRAPVGYCVVAANPMVTNQGFRSLVLTDGIDPFFIRYYVLYSRAYLEDHASGTTFKELSGTALGDLAFPVPPIDQQRRIVARIDELFAEIDDGEAALGRAREDLGTWRKALLKAAVTGELTADWRAANPPAETGADLLARILADRRKRWTDEVRNLGKRVTDPGGPLLKNARDLPAGWTWAGIEQLTTGGIRNGLSLKQADCPTAVKGLKLDALQPNGIDWSRTRYLPIDLNRAAPYLLRAGDLLISRANGSPEFVGRCTMVDSGRDDTVFPDTAIRYPLVDDARLRAWARLAWNAPQSRAQMLTLAKSTAGILKISQGDIAAVALPLPPIAEIAEIVARVERLTAEAESGTDDLAAMSALSSNLRQSILAAAFRGELA